MCFHAVLCETAAFLTAQVMGNIFFPSRWSHLAYQSFPPQCGSFAISFPLLAALPPPEHLNKICAHFLYLTCSFTACLFRQISPSTYPSVIWTRTASLTSVALPLFSAWQILASWWGDILKSWSRVVCVGVIFHSIFHLTGFLTVAMET